MTDTPMQKLLEGCLKDFDRDYFDSVQTLLCNGADLCPSCKSKIDERIKCYKEELEFLEEYIKWEIIQTRTILKEDLEERIAFLKSEIKLNKKHFGGEE